MASQHLCGASRLALIWGSCGCCLLAPWAGAGDKIEFSSPATPWSVPQREVEQKDNKAPASSPGHMATYLRSDYVPVYEESTVIISRSSEMDKHAWDSHTWDSSLMPDGQKKKLSIFDQFLRPDAPSSETNNAGNTGSARNGRDSDFPSNSTSRRNEEKSANSDDLALWGETSTLFGRESDRKEEHFGDRAVDSLGAMPWMKDSDEHEPMTLDRMHHGEFVQFSGGFNSYESPAAGGSFEGISSGVDPLHSSSSPPPSQPEYSTLSGGLPSGGEGHIFSTEGMASAWEAPPSAPAGSIYNSSAEQSWSAGNQRPEPPAVLQFPRRPGDPFQ
jgi:hypothetical protein